MTFSSLNLPQSTGHGLWTATATVENDDWAAAENDLTAQAQAWINDHPDRATGYHVCKNSALKVLTLDLMRGG